jgi:hypothetical protein
MKPRPQVMQAYIFALHGGVECFAFSKTNCSSWLNNVYSSYLKDGDRVTLTLTKPFFLQHLNASTGLMKSQPQALSLFAVRLSCLASLRQYVRHETLCSPVSRSTTIL